MRKLFIISLFLILVLADSHKQKHNHSSAAHTVVRWVIISVVGAIGFFAFRFIVRRRRLMRKMRRQQKHKNLQNTVVQGEPMTPNSESPQFYAVPIEQYQQFQAWQQQQRQQQEWLIQQQQQQLYYQQQQQQSIQQQQQIQQQLLPQTVQQQEQSQYYQQGTPLYPQLNLSQVQMPNIRVGQ